MIYNDCKDKINIWDFEGPEALYGRSPLTFRNGNYYTYFGIII